MAGPDGALGPLVSLCGCADGDRFLATCGGHSLGGARTVRLDRHQSDVGRYRGAATALSHHRLLRPRIIAAFSNVGISQSISCQGDAGMKRLATITSICIAAMLGLII